jgi:4-aminobutyrate aminotransferase-like enzyme
MKKSLIDLMDHHPLIGDVRGLGLLIGVEIVNDRDSKTPAPEQANAICEEAFKRGVFLLNMGSYGSRSLRIAPPLVIDKNEADLALEIIDESISVVENKGY